MVFKKKPEGTQRTLAITVRFRPEVKDAIEKKLASLKNAVGRPITAAELVREAVWQYCKPTSNDPRQP
jgi:hypothetical protein